MNHHSDTELDELELEYEELVKQLENGSRIVSTHKVKLTPEAKQKLLKLIDKEVTRSRNIAKDEVLDDLVEWSELWASMHKEPFNWYGAVKALKIAKDHQKPFNTLTIQEEGTDNEET